MNNIVVQDEGVRLADLGKSEREFLADNGFLGKEPGPEAAALLFEITPKVFAPVVGAAVPNAKRRQFVRLRAAHPGGGGFRMMGVCGFFVGALPKFGDRPPQKAVFLGYDRRTGLNGLYCASFEGGVPGGKTYREGVHLEAADEFHNAVVLNDGKVTRVVPEGFPGHLLGNPDLVQNPFGVPYEDAVESGRLKFMGCHDNTDGGWLSAVFTWDFPGVPGMQPLFAGSRGDYTLAWQDARIPIQGSATKAVARVQSILTAFPLAPILQGVLLNDLPSWGITNGTQGMVRVEGSPQAPRPEFHPTVLRWAELMAASSGVKAVD